LDAQIEQRWQALAAPVTVELPPLPPSSKANRGRRAANDPHFDVRALIYRVVGWT
jgi:hypothetical protein